MVLLPWGYTYDRTPDYDEQMAFFTNLEGSFERYRDVMGLFEYYRRHLSLDLHVVRYEDLV